MSPPPAEQFAARIFMGPALRAQPDRRLVDLVRDGYDAAFEEIVRRYRRPLDRFAAAIVGGRSEDVTQDAFSKALLALRGSGAEIELRPWLYRIVRNTALNDLRASVPVAELSDALPGARSAAAQVEAREELRELMERLQALPETQRAALVMRELEGLSHEEIAAALGVSGGAARQAIFRARAALREGFGLLVPLPLLRALADHGGEAGAAGGAVAVGGGALKAGMATVLIAGAVGAGVAVEHHHGRGAGPEAAEAAPLTGGRHPGAGSARAGAEQSSPAGDDGHGHSGRSGERGGDHRGSGTEGGTGSLSNGSGNTRSSSDGSRSGGSGSGPSPKSGSGDTSGGSDGGGGSGSGSGSGDSGSGSGDDGGTSGGSGDDGLISSGDGSSSGSGSGEIESDPIVTTEPTLSGDGSGDSGSSGDGSGDSTETSGETSGSGDLSDTEATSGTDGSP